MKKAELILIVLTVIILIMRFFHLPVSETLTILSLGTISVFYGYLGFALFNNLEFNEIFKRESYKNISTNRIVGGVGTGLAISIASIGILFRFLSWPGASVMLIMGLIVIIIITIVSLFKIKRSEDNYYLNILKRVVVFGALSVFLFLVPAEIWLKWKYPNNPEYVKAILEARENPDKPELWDKVEEESKKINE